MTSSLVACGGPCDEKPKVHEERSGKRGAGCLVCDERGVPVQPVAKIVEEFAARPWAEVSEADLGAAASVPTMLTPEEGLLYHWLGRRVQGDGAVVDLGAYAGGSAARLLSGLVRAGRGNPVHSFDRFRSSRTFWARYMPDEPLPEADDADLLPVVTRHLAPWGRQVVLHVGDIGEQRWDGGPIEILSVDAAKGSAMADHIAAEFFPALVPGQGVVVQQDYLMPVQPWLCAQMVGMRDCFLPLAHVPKVGLVFLCVAPVTGAALTLGRVDDLTDGKLMSRVREAARWHEGMVARPVFKAMLEQVKAHPGVRLGWQMRKAAQRKR